MSYTVLAVKWRPRRFDELVGQEHIVRALTNSLAAQRLHHAYLFSGTRGVGKTTIGRILAKALNCEAGVVAEPCGVCDACTAIDAGRFVDLIEVDAASRTKVDDTRELLDNVQYAPTRGRFKVYLIDEVHMLSNHSFNALLKTLEEPPPHVKFLLATTDPQKLPVTVLSRCLQFNLKKLSLAQIQTQLQEICAEEHVSAEPGALRAIARAAAGSMRDALSLLDQAIAFSAGELQEAPVNAMLGTIDRAHVVRLLAALASADGSALMREVELLDERAPDYATALDDLMEALQRVAVYQLVGIVDSENHDESVIAEMAARMTPEDVQLYYQIAVQGRRDLPIARDARMAFEMTLLRMLAFRPEQAEPGMASSVPTSSGSGERSRGPLMPPPTDGKVRRQGAGPVRPVAESVPGAKRSPAGGQERGARRSAKLPMPTEDHEVIGEMPPNREWEELIRAADLRGAVRQLAEHCVLLSRVGNRWELLVADSGATLNTDQLRNRLQSLLSEHLGESLQIKIRVGTPPAPTPAQRRAAGETERMRAAREAIENDPNVQALKAAFDAVLEDDSIEVPDASGNGGRRLQ